MNDIQLSEHFMLSEFVNSPTATARGIDNSIPEKLIPNLQALCQEVLEPLRQWYGQPIIISSGYRCPALNKAVGGVRNSQHLKGEAADLQIPTREVGSLWIRHLLEYGHFDQLIKEHSSAGNTWIHVSYKRVGKNRQTYIPNLRKS